MDPVNDSAYYEDLAGRLYGLVIAFSDRLPADQAQWLHHVIEVGEYGLSLEDLAAMLVYDKIAATDQERGDIKPWPGRWEWISAQAGPRRHEWFWPCGPVGLMLRTAWVVVRRIARVPSPPRSMVTVCPATWTVTICPAWMRPKALFCPTIMITPVLLAALDGDRLR